MAWLCELLRICSFPVARRDLHCTVRTVVFGAVLLGWRAPGSGQTMIEDRLVCPACKVEFTEEVRFAELDGPGALLTEPSSVARDRFGRYWVVAHGQMLPAIFDRNGSFVRAVGRRGSGPGEFQGPYLVDILPGDSSLIMDAYAGRAVVLTDDLRPARSVAVPTTDVMSAIVLTWPSAVVVNATIRTAARLGWPLHLLDLSGGTAAIEKSFGHGNGELRPPSRAVGMQLLTASRANGFWAVEATRYRVSKWNDDGNLILSFQRSPEWFPDISRGTRGGPTRKPHPRITAVSEDQRGRIWIFCLVAGPNWSQAWRKALVGTAGSGELNVSSRPPLNALYETMVEVVDPGRQRVVASQRIPRAVVTALHGAGDVRVVAYAETGEGVPTASILTLRLREADR
jgi:hypothetical protein